MRPLLALSILLALSACTNPLEPWTDPVAYQQHVHEFFSGPGQPLVAPTAVVVYGAANTRLYSSTVRTPNGTFDATTACAFDSCDSTVSKR